MPASSPADPGRRQFLLRSSAGLAALLLGFRSADLLAAHASAAASPESLAFFTAAQMRLVELITDRIVPATDGLPGARDARAARFIDRGLARFLAAEQPAYTEGLAALEARARELYPAATGFAALAPEERDEVLRAIESTPFFQMIRADTFIGCFSHPEHGGNFQQAGWHLLGNDALPTHRPPFGWYDRGHHSTAELAGTAAAPRATPRSPAPHPRFPLAEPVDFVVVGVGAAGGVMCWELTRAGFGVVALEQGPYLTEKDFTHDDVKVMLQHALTNDDQGRQPQTFRKAPDEEAKRATPVAPIWYGRAVGGGSLHFTANYWRFREIDFIEHGRVGDVPGANLADWPITYADLEPYYTRAEWVLGVSGQAGANPFDPPRSRPYPLPPMPVKSGGVLFDRGARALGWHPFPAPVAILSRPYDGRLPCQHCGRCMGFGCEYGAKSSALVSVVRQAERTGRLEIRPRSYVRKIQLDDRGRVTGVVYFDENGTEQFQRAKAVIVCANGAETPRLLLLSKSNRFPDGLANSSGDVGKHLMWNTYTGSFGIFEHEIDDWRSIQSSRALWDFYDTDPARGCYGGGGIDARWGALSPIDFSLTAAPPDEPQWGASYARALRESWRHGFTAAGHGTSLPVPANAIDLDPELKDAWGLPAMRVTYRDHPDDVRFAQFLADRSLELLTAAGAIKTWNTFPAAEQTTFAVHLLGTCRMGNDPRTSVVDAMHRTHDVPNLFLCDGSSFVTSGRGQPTCTIQALAFRAGELIARAARRGEI